MPEIDNWHASLAPRNVTMRGSRAGVRECWRMDFAFFAEDGSKLLDTVGHIARVTNQEPETVIGLPHRESQRLRLQREVYL